MAITQHGHMRPWRIGIIAAVVLLVSGCVAPKDPTAQAAADQIHLAKAASLQTFRVTGGIGIWTEEESVSASVDWSQQFDQLQIKLTAPIGFTSLTLEQQPGRAALIRGNAPRVEGPSGGQLLQRALGLSVPVPLDQLSQWIRGLPGDANDIRYDAVGRVSTLAYTDSAGTRWNAEIRKRTTVGDINVPALITARGGPYNLRLVLKRWEKDSAVETPKNTGPTRIAIPNRS
jgi:outer membrane lipoprotein LolB